MADRATFLADLPVRGADIMPAIDGFGAETTVQAALDQLVGVNALPAVASRTAALDAWATRPPTVKALSWVQGQVPALSVRTLRVIERAGSTVLPGMPNAEPDGDVHPEHFGAKGDGVANDAAAVQAADNYCRATSRRLVGIGVYSVSSMLDLLSPHIELRLLVGDDFVGENVVRIGWQLAAAEGQVLPLDPYMPAGLTTTRENQGGHHRIHIDGRHNPVPGNTAHLETGFFFFGVRSPLIDGHYTGSRLYRGAICTNDFEKQIVSFGFINCARALRLERNTTYNPDAYTDTTPSECNFRLKASQCGQFLELAGLGSSRVLLSVESTIVGYNLPCVHITGGHSSVLAGILRGPNSTVATILVENDEMNPNAVHFDNLLVQVDRFSPALVVNRVYNLTGHMIVEVAYAGAAVIKKVVGGGSFKISALRSQILAGNGYEAQPLVVLGDPVDGDLRSLDFELNASDMRDTPKRKLLVVHPSIGAFDTNANNDVTAPTRAVRVKVSGDGTTGGIDILDSRVITSGEMLAARNINWLNQTTFRSLTLANSKLAGNLQVNNNQAVAIPPIRRQGYMTVSFPGSVTHRAQIYYNKMTGAVDLINGCADVAVMQNTALTGTTGAAGGWTISAKDGLIYVENRLGSDTTMWVDL